MKFAGFRRGGDRQAGYFCIHSAYAQRPLDGIDVLVAKGFKGISGLP